MSELGLAFAAGVLTAGAPCVLPALPIVLGGSVGRASATRPVFIALGFAAAFSALVLFLRTGIAWLGLSPSDLRAGAILLLALFGLALLWSAPFEWLVSKLEFALAPLRRVGERAGPGNLGGFALGLSLGAVWTPCAGPVLGSILALIATSDDSRWAGVLLVAYALGAGLPMLAIAYGGQWATTRVRALARYTEPARRALGVSVIAVAFAIHAQYDALLVAWLTP